MQGLLWCRLRDLRSWLCPPRPCPSRVRSLHPMKAPRRGEVSSVGRLIRPPPGLPQKLDRSETRAPSTHDPGSPAPSAGPRLRQMVIKAWDAAPNCTDLDQPQH